MLSCKLEVLCPPQPKGVGGTYCFWCESCRRLHSFLSASISWTIGWILTKLAQTHYWDGGKKWLDFGDLDLLFKVTPALWMSNFRRRHPYFLVSWTNGWILTKLAQTHYWDGGKKWLDFADHDFIFKVTPTHWNFQIFTKKACLHPVSWTKWWVLAKRHIL